MREEMLFPFHREAESRDLIDVISLWQPWASWVAWGWKTIETRTHDRFQSLAGRRLVIHAAKTWDPRALDVALPYLSEEQITASLNEYVFPRGAFLCVVNVVDHRRLTSADAAAALIECESVTRYGLELCDVRQLDPPVAARGRQQIWQVSSSLVAPAS